MHRSRSPWSKPRRRNRKRPAQRRSGGTTSKNPIGRANRPDAVDLAQPIWSGLDDFEHLLAKGANEFFGVDRSHAPDHAGREVSFDAVGRPLRYTIGSNLAEPINNKRKPAGTW